MSMNMGIKKVKLTDHDRRIISKNSDICTDAHGKACSIGHKDEKGTNLN